MLAPLILIVMWQHLATSIGGALVVIATIYLGALFLSRLFFPRHWRQFFLSGIAWMLFIFIIGHFHI